MHGGPQARTGYRNTTHHHHHVHWVHAASSFLLYMLQSSRRLGDVRARVLRVGENGGEVECRMSSVECRVSSVDLEMGPGDMQRVEPQSVGEPPFVSEGEDRFTHARSCGRVNSE
jgi:hypothetical protein